MQKNEMHLQQAKQIVLQPTNRNSSGAFLVPPGAAGGEKGKDARTPRAPARGLRPPAPPAEELPSLLRFYLYSIHRYVLY